MMVFHPNTMIVAASARQGRRPARRGHIELSWSITVCNSRTARRLKPLRFQIQVLIALPLKICRNVPQETCRPFPLEARHWKHATGNVNLFLHAKIGNFFYRTQLDPVQLDGTPIQPAAHPQSELPAVLITRSYSSRPLVWRRRNCAALYWVISHEILATERGSWAQPVRRKAQYPLLH